MEKVTFGPSNLPGFEIGDKTLPAVIVIQEWWGVTVNIKELAQMISKEGFRCLVPDLYKGKIGVDAEEASHVGGTGWEGVLRTVRLGSAQVQPGCAGCTRRPVQEEDAMRVCGVQQGCGCVGIRFGRVCSGLWRLG